MIRIVGTFPRLGRLVEWYLDEGAFLQQRIPVAYTNGYDRWMFDEREIPGLREDVDRCHHEILDAEVSWRSQASVMWEWQTHRLAGPRTAPRCLPLGLVMRPMATELQEFDTELFNA